VSYSRLYIINQAKCLILVYIREREKREEVGGFSIIIIINRRRKWNKPGRRGVFIDYLGDYSLSFRLPN
jgi:hypothetical protein